jgi:hypothetical protein
VRALRAARYRSKLTDETVLALKGSPLDSL